MNQRIKKARREEFEVRIGLETKGKRVRLANMREKGSGA